MNPLSGDLNHILDHTRPLWDELRGERIFITGGTGFFGCWLLESFLWANDRLKLHSKATILTRHPDHFLAKAPHLAKAEPVTLLRGDVQNYPYPPGSFQFLIHAATESNATQNLQYPKLLLDSIYKGTNHTFDFAASHQTKKLLLTSSGAVYGKQPPSLSHIPENYQGAPDPLDPKSAYAQGKRLAEHLSALFSQDSSLQIKIARCFAFVGPYLPLNIHFAVGNFIRDGLNGGPIIIQGDGTPRRSYMYAADLAIWLWTILFNGQIMRPYNVGSEESVSIFDVANKVSSLLTPNIKITINKPPDPSRPLEQYVPDTKRAATELDLQVWVDLSSGIRSTLDWNKE